MTVLGFVLLCNPGTRVHRVLTHAHRGSQSRPGTRVHRILIHAHRGSQSRPGTLVHRVLIHHTQDHRVDLGH